MCRTESISVGGGTSAKFRCDCSVPGFIGVGMVIGDVYVNNSVKVLFHHVQNVTFRYEGLHILNINLPYTYKGCKKEPSLINE